MNASRLRPAWPFLLLAIAGGLVLLLRGRPLLPLVALSSLVVLPYLSGETNPLLNGRYLMPVAIVGIVFLLLSLTACSRTSSGSTSPSTTRRRPASS